jgi:hypothetical protein
MAALAKLCAAKFVSTEECIIYQLDSEAIVIYLFFTNCLNLLRVRPVKYKAFNTWNALPLRMIFCKPKSLLKTAAWNATKASIVYYNQ